MVDTPEIEVDPKVFTGLTLMRRLVTTLLVVMIVGFVILIFLLISLFPSQAPETLSNFDLPDHIILPDNATLVSTTFAQDWIGVAADTDEGGVFYIFDREQGNIKQTIVIE